MITLDCETRSLADLKKVGTAAYAEHESTDIICVCYGIDDHPIQEWWPESLKEGRMPSHDPVLLVSNIPADLYIAMSNPLQAVEAHHVGFERAIWTYVLSRKYGWPMPQAHQWRDTMAVACYYGLPAALDGLLRAIGAEGKDPEGARLISKYSKLHLKTAKSIIPPQDFRKFVNYCKDDVMKEQWVSDWLGDLPARELPVFQLDQRINWRGLNLDIEGIDAATSIVDQRSEILTAEFNELTGVNPGQLKAVMAWCEENGTKLENLQADYLKELLEDDDLFARVPQGDVRRAIEIRLEISKASTKKLDAMARQRSTDGRARLQTRFHGAGTGRWTGTGFQPLNLVRGFEDVAPEQLVRDILYRDALYLDRIYGDAMDAVSKASRHWIKAADDWEIFAGDYASIEAVILACEAGEQWKINAFANEEPIYELMGDKIHKLPPGTVTKASHPMERQDGKTCELAFGYQGALGAWLKFDSSGRHSDERIIEICKSWRAEHPAIVGWWTELNEACLDAVRLEGCTTLAGTIGFEMVDEWLTMILPNEKRLWYFRPQIRMMWPQWHQPSKHKDCANETCNCNKRPQVTYMAQKEGQWRRVHTYGGKLAENAVQATSREVLVEAMLRIDEAWGVPLRKKALLAADQSVIILSVYDEIICEVPKGWGSLDEFKDMMEVRPEWAKDWPISVSCWSGQRYQKA